MTPRSSAFIFGGVTLVAIAGGIAYSMMQSGTPTPVATATATQTATSPTPVASASATPAPPKSPVPAVPTAAPPAQPDPPAPDPPLAPVREVESCVVKMATVNDPDPPLNVRSAPTAGSAKVGQLQNGTYVTVVQEENGWFKISDPVTGWIAKTRTNNGCSQKVERVNFSKGEISVALSDKFIGTGYHRYLFNAGKGQTLTIRVQDGPLPFVLAPNGKTMMENYNDTLTQWSQVLPETGDYTVQLDSNYRGYTYSFVVEIK